MATENKNLSALLNPLSKDNPVIVQILGICSCLAVTAKLEPAFVMGISVIAVLAFGQCNHIIASQYYPDKYTHHRTTGCCRRSCRHSKSATYGLSIRCEQTAVSVHRAYRHQLHTYGTS